MLETSQHFLNMVVSGLLTSWSALCTTAVPPAQCACSALLGCSLELAHSWHSVQSLGERDAYATHCLNVSCGVHVPPIACSESLSGCVQMHVAITEQPHQQVKPVV